MKISSTKLLLLCFSFLYFTWIGLGIYADKSLPYQLLSLIILLFLPGLLTLKAIDAYFDSIWLYIVHSVGLSIGWIYILGLFGSSLLPKMRIFRPLDMGPYVVMHVILILVLLVFVSIKKWRSVVNIPEFSIVFPFIFGYIGVSLLSLISIWGAFTLNSGGSNTISLIWFFCVVSAAFVITLFQNEKLVCLRPFAIFMLSLSLLWLLSARSWHINGWDIVQEYVTASSTLIHGRWSTDFIKDAYNACLSITILPTVIQNTSHISIETTYKYIYPFLFAHFPVIIYFWLKKISNKNVAMLSVIYVIAQPFFVQPMIALARQEIAFLIFAILLSTLFSTEIHKKARNLLVLFYIFTLVTSHYSTTYVTIAMFSSLFIFNSILRVIRFIPIHNKIKSSNFYSYWVLQPNTNVKWWAVGALLLISFIWYVPVTHSADNISSTVLETFSNMNKMFLADSKSTEVKQALPGKKNVTFVSDADISDFENAYEHDLTNLKPGENHAIQSAYPLTAVNEVLIRPSVTPRVASISNNVLRFIKDLLKYLLIASSTVFIFMSFRKLRIHRDIIILIFIGTGILILVTVNPTLGVRYNISRIYLQLLVFLSFALIYAIDQVLQVLKSKFSTYALELTVFSMLIYLQGAIVPLIGGVPIMQFYSNGTDYNKFYVFTGEINSAFWLQKHRDFSSTVYGDYLTGLRLRRGAQLFPNTTIIPAVIANNGKSYVYLSSTNKNLNITQVNFGDKQITYTFPSSFLQKNKNEIYSNKHSSIFK